MGLSKANHTCPDKTLADPPQLPVVGNLSFRQLAVILSGACMAFSCLVSFYLILRHATHFSIPKEQKQIIRIIFMIPVFAILSFLGVCFMDASIYLTPFEDLFESFALASFFLLMCTFVHEDEDERQAFFQTSGTIANYHKSAFGAFQFPIVMLIIVIVTEITEGAKVYCTTSNKPYFAHIWITVVTVISTAFAIISILRFYKLMKHKINHRRPLPKLITFKAIVFLNFIQKTIFSFLTSSSDLKPTSHVTFKDLTVALPNLLISLEMVLFSLAFLYVYRTREYCFKRGATAVPLGHGGYFGGFLGTKAIFEALNIVDLVRGIISVAGGIGLKDTPRKYGSGDQYEGVEMAPPIYRGQNYS